MERGLLFGLAAFPILCEGQRPLGLCQNFSEGAGLDMAAQALSSSRVTVLLELLRFSLLKTGMLEVHVRLVSF